MLKEGLTMFQKLTPGSQIYAKIYRHFLSCWTKDKCPPVNYIFEIFNTQLKRRWEAYKVALEAKGSPTDTEKYFHGTTIKCDLAHNVTMCSHDDCGICGISQKGFKMAYVSKDISKRFGHGLYLAPNSSKSHDYTQGSHTHRAMLLCDVLPGKKHVVTTNHTHLTAPPPGYDSVYGQAAAGGSLKYSEIVLYEEVPILPRYIIMYEKDGIGNIAR